jgi:hypothetical protein
MIFTKIEAPDPTKMTIGARFQPQFDPFLPRACKPNYKSARTNDPGRPNQYPATLNQ